MPGMTSRGQRPDHGGLSPANYYTRKSQCSSQVTADGPLPERPESSYEERSEELWRSDRGFVGGEWGRRWVRNSEDFRMK